MPSNCFVICPIYICVLFAGAEHAAEHGARAQKAAAQAGQPATPADTHDRQGEVAAKPPRPPRIGAHRSLIGARHS